MEGPCIFKFRYGAECDDSKNCITNKGRSRIDSIIKASKLYNDDLHIGLEGQLSEDEHLSVYYHKNCVSRYTSSSNTLKYAKDNVADKPPAKKLRRSHTSFNFITHCLYCGEDCPLTKDPKHPNRWRPAYICRSTVSGHDRTPYKQYILDKCNSRNDAWADEVRVRIHGAVSDLHAAEARYHKACMSRFFCDRVNPAGECHVKLPSHSENIADSGWKYVVTAMSKDQKRIWSSVELYEDYVAHGGEKLTRSKLVEELCCHFDGELVILSSPGYANIVVFRVHASVLLKMVKHDDDDDIGSSINKVAKRVVKECSAIPMDRTKYRLDINTQLADEAVSDTIQILLAAISSKLDSTPPALLIGNIITSVLRSQPTDLQVSLGLLLRDYKSLLGYTYDFGITCSYDEVLRFKKSAAAAAMKDPCIHGISTSESGLVQTIVDNFDADIHSPNGKVSTHSLAMILTQPTTVIDNEDNSIIRLKHEDLSLPMHEPEDAEYYVGEKKPPMLKLPTPTDPDRLSTHQRVSNERASDLDFQFFNDIYRSEDCPEYNGYNTNVCREQGHSLKPKTNIVYLPLIDKPPADPSTIMTALVRAKVVSEGTGQEYVVFTADQQLYRVAVHVLWENPARFSNIYLRLGGMHLLMSYIGCIGTLMEGSGIAEVLSEAFGGVLKMLSGKKFPENVRALRLLVEELLRPVFCNNSLQNMDDLQRELDYAASQSRTAKLWIGCLITPVLTIMKYIRAEREADWPLHLAAVNDMMPLFFAAGHYNYARYGLYYLRSMAALPDDVHQHFMKGEHTIHHNPGCFNGTWSDMGIETTYMRYGHGHGGIIGITLRPETLKTWAYSLHACNTVVNNLDTMRARDKPPSQAHHKEEMKARIKSDGKDRQVLRDKLELCIDPLKSDPTEEGLVNIVTGQVVTHPSVNVDNAVEIGCKEMDAYEGGWPTKFHDTIHKSVTTMAVSRRHIKVDDVKVYDTELIYARAMALQCSLRNFDTSNLMSYELSPKPASMFDDNGNMKTAKTKSSLKNDLKVEESVRNSQVDATFLDGCAIFWVVTWPTGGVVQDYLNNFRKHIQSYLESSDVYLVFDRYRDGSIKESTRSDRDKGASRVYSLRSTGKLPPQKVVLTVSANKKQLIDLIVDDLISHKDELKSSLVVTGNDPTPVHIQQGVVIRRSDMSINHEEADTMIIQQVASVRADHVLVVADDTDIFVLLCHFVYSGDVRSHVMMISPIRGRTCININATVQKHLTIMPDLLAAHGLTGCDTVATYHGIGKGMALKILRANTCSLSKIGDANNSVEQVMAQATQFMLSCYRQPECDTMTAARQQIWSRKVSHSIGGAPKLQTLPPTTEAFRENVARAHLQVAIWRHATDPNTPAIDPLTHGWTQDSGSSSLTPTTVAPNVATVPLDVLKMIKCSCESSMPCKSKRCGCYNASMACTVFCACRGEEGCFNPKTIERLQAEDNEDGVPANI